jgi:hypothetical protein
MRMGRKWVMSELAKARSMRRRGVPVEQIAELLDRTPRAIYHKTRGYRPLWTPALERELMGLSSVKLWAEQHGFTANAAHVRRSRIRRRSPSLQ